MGSIKRSFWQAVLTFSANGTRQTCGLHCAMSVGHLRRKEVPPQYVRRADELRCVKVHGGERINILERSSFEKSNETDE